MTIVRADTRKQLQEGLNAVFGLAYREWPKSWSDIFMENKSNKSFEEEVMQTGLGAAMLKPEGRGIEYDEMQETYVARYNHITFGIAVAITEEAIEDNLYAEQGQRIARAMARSMAYFEEVQGANVLNNGFDSNYAGGDGVQLFSTAHPIVSGTLSNTLATPADLSESALEEAAIQISNWTDERGIPVQSSIRGLVIPTDSQFVATRLLMTPYQPDTNDNNINAMFKLGTIKNGFSVNRYLTDSDSWFLTTDIDNGLKYFLRRALKKGVEGDFETGNLRYKVTKRSSFGWSNFRGAFGSAGA